MPRKTPNRMVTSPEAQQWRYKYKATVLGEVVTVPEILILWGKARITVDRAVMRGELEARTAITGGSMLVTYRSVVALWGEPTNGNIPKPEEETKQMSMFALEELAKIHAPYKGYDDDKHKP